MTLKTEVPVSIEQRIHRVYHQHHHHHHYHLHHILDHHHLHIHNQSVFRSHVPTSQQQGDIAIDEHGSHSVSGANVSHNTNQPIEQYAARNRNTTTKTTTKSKRIRFLLTSAFAYIISPIDLIPEAIFGIFGILDDLIFLLMCLFCIAIILLYPLVRELSHKKCAILRAAACKQPSTVCQLDGLASLGDGKE
uniref:RING finger protein 170 n=1 Tax=Aceria tosichella TaxID=561515 RepID=A0A6G1SPV7_9ACAR